MHLLSLCSKRNFTRNELVRSFLMKKAKIRHGIPWSRCKQRLHHFIASFGSSAQKQIPQRGPAEGNLTLRSRGKNPEMLIKCLLQTITVSMPLCRHWTAESKQLPTKWRAACCGTTSTWLSARPICKNGNQQGFPQDIANPRYGAKNRATKWGYVMHIPKAANAAHSPKRESQ